MDTEYIQLLRYKLQKRLKRLNSANYASFHYTLVQTWNFFQENEIIKGILDDLEKRHATAEQSAVKMVSQGGTPEIGETENENNSICYWVIKKCAALPKTLIEANIGHKLANVKQHDEALEYFRLAYIEPIFDYIDEQIDDKRMALILLKKFKQRCEWFHREELYEKFKADTGSGEKKLANNLYEYLHDQGISFHIEPQSASGRVDLVAEQTGKDRLIADVKLFNPDRGQDRGYVIKGFRQVYEYTKDFNEPFGYLVIFKTCEKDLSISTAKQEITFPFITHNNKTIFIIVIDIFDYPESASKRGKLESYEIQTAEFVNALNQPA